MTAKRVRISNTSKWIEVEYNRAYIYSSEDAKDPYEIFDSDGET